MSLNPSKLKMIKIDLDHGRKIVRSWRGPYQGPNWQGESRVKWQSSRW